MQVNVLPGKYIVAVSGGVDSMTLLNLLSKREDLEAIVAHFNHGIRPEAAADADFVVAQAARLGLPLEIGEGQLGPAAGEAAARHARYAFLRDLRDKYEADGIITAHHQDDLIETALLNLLRGSGPRGVIAIMSNREIIRPLLDIPKSEIIMYASANKISWREDQTNTDPRYLRNHIRKILNEKLNQDQRAEVLEYIRALKNNAAAQDSLIDGINPHLFNGVDNIKRSAFIFLPNEVGREVVVRWLRSHKIAADRPLVERVAAVIKTGKPGSLHSVSKAYRLRLSVAAASLEYQG